MQLDQYGSARLSESQEKHATSAQKGHVRSFTA
jgi:hypothetical protein